MTARHDVLGLGVAAWDSVTRLERWPAADQKVTSDTLVTGGGGPVATALVTLARLGRSAAFAGSVGDDGPGRLVLEELRTEGVDTALAAVVPGARTTWAFCVAHGASRNVFSVRGTAPSRRLDSSELDALLDCRALHLDGSEEQASLVLAREARRRGVLTSLDGGSLRPTTTALLEYIDLLVMSEPFFRDLAGREAGAEGLEQLHRPGRLLTAVTLGPRGSLAWDGKRLLEAPAESVEVVDSTGAGDAFHGALLAGVLEGLELPRALALASHVAARCCQALGGRRGIPRRAELADWFS